MMRASIVDALRQRFLFRSFKSQRQYIYTTYKTRKRLHSFKKMSHPTVIIDAGSGQTKVGFSNEEDPRAVMMTAVGRLRNSTPPVCLYYVQTLGVLIITGVRLT